MPRRDTMHLRNDRALTLVIALFFLIIGTGAQSTPSSPPATNTPQSQAPAPQQSTPQPNQTPEPAPGQQPAQPAPGAPVGQEPDTAGGGFVFRAQAQEVVLHA